MTARGAAAVAAALTGLATLYTLALLAGMPDPAWAYLPRGLIHVGELAAVVALALCGAAGTGWLGRVGLGLAGLGAALLAVAEVLTGTSPGVSETLFGIAPILVGLGLLLAGVAVVRSGVWTGWRRWVVLGLGVFVFAVLTPVLIAAGGPPAPGALWALAGWEALWVLVAVAVLVETAGASRGLAPAAGHGAR